MLTPPNDSSSSGEDGSGESLSTMLFSSTSALGMMPALGIGVSVDSDLGLNWTSLNGSILAPLFLTGFEYLSWRGGGGYCVADRNGRSLSLLWLLLLDALSAAD